ASSATAHEQRSHTGIELAADRVADHAREAFALSAASLQIVQLTPGLVGNGQLSPVTARIQALGEGVECLAVEHAAGVLHIRGTECATSVELRLHARERGGAPNVSAGGSDSVSDGVDRDDSETVQTGQPMQTPLFW